MSASPSVNFMYQSRSSQPMKSHCSFICVVRSSRQVFKSWLGCKTKIRRTISEVTYKIVKIPVTFSQHTLIRPLRVNLKCRKVIKRIPQLTNLDSTSEKKIIKTRVNSFVSKMDDLEGRPQKGWGRLAAAGRETWQGWNQRAVSLERTVEKLWKLRTHVR